MPRREVSPGAAKNVLLILGGLLLTVAAVVFTMVSWGRLGIGGRAAVLAAFTVLVMLAPVVLVRRKLTATAETVAGLAVALLLLDGYAARRVGLLGVDTLDALQYTAGVCAVTALILVPYARVTQLRGPAPVAVVLAQPVLPLLTGDLSTTWLVTALVATAALDVIVVRMTALNAAPGRTAGHDVTQAGTAARNAAPVGTATPDVAPARTAEPDIARLRHSRGAVRVTAALAGSGLAALAMLIGAPYALGSPSVGEALNRSAPLIALALLGGFVTWRLARPGRVEQDILAATATVGTALTLIAVPAALVLPTLDGPGTDWYPLAFLVPALVVMLAASWLPWRTVRLTGMITGGLVALLVTLTLLPRLMVTLAAPFAWLDVLGTGRWDGRQWQPFETTSPADVAVLAMVALGLLATAVRSTGGRPMRAATSGAPASETQASGVRMSGVRASGEQMSGMPVFGTLVSRALVVGALVFVAVMVAVVPQVFAMPYLAAVVVQVLLAVVPAVVATLGRTPWWAVACAIVAGPASVRAAAYAFGSEPATLTVLPILAMTAAAVALAARVKELRPWGLGFVVLFLGLEAMAAALSLGLRVMVAASVGFTVAGVLVLVMSLWAGPAGRVGVWQGAASAGQGGVWQGVVFAGRGGVSGLRYIGAILLLLASWLRLGADEVTVVEAYTVPCSLVLLGSGWWRRRGAPIPSWAAYGAGLSVTMLPSLVAVYSDTEWRRSLALGVVALAVLVVGARFRLQAPTVIGAVVVAGVAVRELAPYVSEMLLTVPRWVPIAVGGLLLVVVGATYEARMRDLRRLRDTLTAMG
ncbi:SCO7613 C-terminal domain-containing membrane protein [Nonomuraea rhizosphaerae]|uniref:SCO7613 C-terminal domain-containing membrane protein n=1 Tax=Nonomuraea rhizosphaerae TaxID=2665663 RepID=UPI001C5CEB32|nr:hypothetical protein [Nonomuraea rhizosphaerae]